MITSGRTVVVGKGSVTRLAFLRRGALFGGQKLLRESLGVVIEQRRHALGFSLPQNQSLMVVTLDSHVVLWIVVRLSILIVLPSRRKNSLPHTPRARAARSW